MLTPKVFVDGLIVGIGHGGGHATAHLIDGVGHRIDR